MLVMANFFDVTGVPLSLGRPFTELEAGAELDPRLAVVTHSFWRDQLRSDSPVVGRTLLFDGEPYTVTGILAPNVRSVAGFAFSPGVYLSINRSNLPALTDPENSTVALIGRLKPNQRLSVSSLRLRDHKRLG